MRSHSADKKKRHLVRIMPEVVMSVISFLVITPIIYLVIASFKSKADIYRPLSFPSSLYLKNYINVIVEGKYFVLLFNSAVVCSFSVALIVILGSLASYPLARNNNKKYNLIFLYFISGYMIPFLSGMVPLYKMLRSLGLVNTLTGLIVVFAGLHMPMAILIFTGFIKTVPRELDEAARIDGCSTIRTFFSVVLPLTTPAIVSVIILTIIPIWNDFLVPLLFISSNGKKTLPLGMYGFMGERTVAWGPILAFGTLIGIIPVVLFLVLQKYFYKGIVSGSVKG